MSQQLFALSFQIDNSEKSPINLICALISAIGTEDYLKITKLNSQLLTQLVEFYDQNLDHFQNILSFLGDLVYKFSEIKKEKYRIKIYENDPQIDYSWFPEEEYTEFAKYLLFE